MADKGILQRGDVVRSKVSGDYVIIAEVKDRGEIVRVGGNPDFYNADRFHLVKRQLFPHDWKPTHRHYKGGLYRVLRRDYFVKADFDAEDWIIMEDWGRVMVTDNIRAGTMAVIYEHEGGNRYLRPQAMFDDESSPGQKRFTPIV